jgi:adenylate kinase family enzyme
MRAGRRVIIIGSSNAGKSTLGSQLAQRLGVPFIELDALHWEPGWREAEHGVFRERVRRVTEADAWVLDGNYLQHQQDISWPRADTIVWLDLSLPLVLRRCVARCWRRWRTQEILYGGNRERFFEHLMVWNPEKSLPGHVLRTYRARRKVYEAFMRDPQWSHLTFVRLRSPEEVQRWLAATAAHPTAAR